MFKKTPDKALLKAERKLRAALKQLLLRMQYVDKQKEEMAAQWRLGRSLTPMQGVSLSAGYHAVKSDIEKVNKAVDEIKAAFAAVLRLPLTSQERMEIESQLAQGLEIIDEALERPVNYVRQGTP